MLLNPVGNQLITILWAIYRYVYHLGDDNMNTFVNDAAEKPFAPLMACDFEECFCLVCLILLVEPNITVNTTLFFSFAIQEQLLVYHLNF